MGTQAHVISNFLKVVNSPRLPTRWKTYQVGSYWRQGLISIALHPRRAALPTSRRAGLVPAGSFELRGFDEPQDIWFEELDATQF